jgi:hypothetical protein
LGLLKRLPLIFRRDPLLFRLEPKLGRSEIAFLSEEDSTGFPLVCESSFIGEIAEAISADESEPSLPPLLCKLLLLLPEVALPIECLFLSFELALCKS